MEKEDIAVVEEKEALSGIVEDYWIVKLKKPFKFEENVYNEIDLKGLDDIKTGDMVDINRRMARNGSFYVTPEITLEYALNIANLATGLPLEFFDQLPPYAAIAIKERVTSFLYGRA